MQVPSRSTIPLSKPLTQRLNAYTLAAGAAGVGLLASAPSAQARIVYTPANIPIARNAGTVELDLNNDGISDFQFSNTYYSQAGKRPPEGFVQFSLTVSPAQQGDGVLTVEDKHTLCAAHLHKGHKVGPKSPFQPGQSALPMFAGAGDYTSFHSVGPWLKVKSGYLGLKFVIQGKTHFGWARIRMAGESSPTIVGYAYETIPNRRILTGQKKDADKVSGIQPISQSAAAPQAGTLALLAAGSSGRTLNSRPAMAGVTQ